MGASRILSGPALLAALLALSCLGDRLVAPEEHLPPVLAVDRPIVQLFRFARGRMVRADTVRITNNGEGFLGPVERVGGVDYITTARIGWLKTIILNLGDDEALLILEPTYAEEEQDQADVAEVVLKAQGSPELKRVKVFARTLRGARFEFSVSPLTFAAVPGDPELTQSLTVRNSGNGTLIVRPPSVHYRQGAGGWLTTTWLGGAETAPEFQVGADPEGLEGGLHEAFLVFESLPSEETRARPDSVSVQLNVGQPALSTSSSALSFTAIKGGADPAPQSLFLSNSGEGGFSALGTLGIGAVTYRFGAEGWLDVTLEEAAVRLAVRTSSLVVGEYEAVFPAVSESGGSRDIQVALSVEAPVLTLAQRTVSFGLMEDDAAPPPAQRVPVANTGSGTLANLGPLSLGSMNPPVPWLSAALAGPEIVLTPTTAATALLAGEYSTRLPIRSAHGGSDTLSVSLSVSRGLDPPKLALSASEVEFSGVTGGVSPPSQEIQVANAGGGSLGAVSVAGITYSGEEGWLSASLADETITLTASTGSLPAGRHLATVPVSSTQGGGALVQVAFSVGSPVLTASTTSVSFSAQEGGGSPPGRAITLSNTGPGTFANLGTISLGSIGYGGMGGWLSASLSGQTLTLAVATGVLPAGTHEATIPVRSAYGGQVSVRVTFTVTRLPDAADLVATPVEVRMSAVRGGADPPGQTVFLSNGGGGTLGQLGVSGINYGGGPSGWLSAVLAASTVTLDATTGSLAPGTYGAQVGLSSANGGEESVAVTFVVGAPVLTLAATSVGFSGQEGGSASPASVSVSLLNTGAGGLADLGTIGLGPIVYGGPGGWLIATLSAGGSQVDLTAALGNLAPGIFGATVPVQSSAGGSASIQVSLSVAPEPADPVLVLSSATAGFFAEAGGNDPASQAINLSNGGGGGVPALGALSLGAITYVGTSGWLAATLANAVVTLSPTTGALAIGSYQATVPVQSVHGGTRNLTVSFEVTDPGAPADLEVSPSGVRMDAVVGGPSPPDREVLLYNGGGGTLGSRSVVGITYANGAGWLSASLSASVLKLSANVAGLGVGTYGATVEVASANGGNEPVSVTLVVAAPVLTLSSGSAHFNGPEGGGASPASVSVDLSNTGAGDFSNLGGITLGATIYGGAGGWLTTGLSAGDTRVVLSAAIGGLGPGTYTATVPVSSGYGGSRSIAVVLAVSPSAEPPVLSLSASEVDFTAVLGGNSPAPKNIGVANTGGGTLADLGTLGVGTITYGATSSGWLSTSSLSGATLTLSPVTGSLGEGIHTAVVPVTSQAGGTQSVTVSVDVGVPVLTASTLGISFSGEAGGLPPATEAVSFSNTGAGDLGALGSITVVSVVYGAGASGWLHEPSTGMAVSGGSLAFSALHTGLVAGAYTATVRVSSEFGGSQTISVTLTVARTTDPPTLVLSATEQRFDALAGGASPDPQHIVASNAGGGSLGTIRAESPRYGGGATGWLSASVEGNTLTTKVQTGSLVDGTYTASLPVSSDGGGVEVAVTFVVGASRLTLSPKAVSVGDTVGGSGPDAVAVGITNTGGGTFGDLGAIALQPPVYGPGAGDWLTSTLVAPDSLLLRARTGSLLPRPEPFRATVPVVSTLGGSDTVLVSFTVAPGASPPRLSLSLDSISFAGIRGGDPPLPQKVEAFNSGGGELGALRLGAIDFEEGSGGWLTGSVSGMTVTLDPTVEGLPAGTHRATVSVSSERGGIDSVDVALILGAPAMTLSTRTVTFSDTVGSPDTLRAQVFLSNTGAGNRASLGLIRLGTVSYPEGGEPWLSTVPGQEEPVEGFVVTMDGSAATLEEGSWPALVPVISQWGGADTVEVTFSAREPDRSFDLPTIEFVKDSLSNGTLTHVPLPGDSMVVGPLAADSAVRIGVRNGSETRVTLSGLRVGIPSYPQGQPGGWITGAFLSRTTATLEEPAELIVVLDPRGLATGRYEGRLVISSEAPSLEQVAPRVLRVVLRVE